MPSTYSEPPGDPRMRPPVPVLLALAEEEEKRAVPRDARRHRIGTPASGRLLPAYLLLLIALACTGLSVVQVFLLGMGVLAAVMGFVLVWRRLR